MSIRAATTGFHDTGRRHVGSCDGVARARPPSSLTEDGGAGRGLVPGASAPETAKYQGALVQALQWSERWAEAKAVADARLATTPGDVDTRGLVGTLSARLGDAAQARRIEAELAALTRPYLHGAHTHQRACIAAQLGEKDRSVALLRDAFAQGYIFNIDIHRDIDLEPLWGYPPYEELMRPKG